MKYDEALEAWGALKLKEYRTDLQGLEFEAVSVSMDFSEGYACCGGSNPDCYCSFAEAPRAEVNIIGYVKDGNKYSDYGVVSRTIDLADFDFTTVLREICEAAGGAVKVV